MLFQKSNSWFPYRFQRPVPSPWGGRAWLFLSALLFLTACTGNKVYDSYMQTSLAGWEKNDTVTFGVPPVAQEGVYRAELGLRINGTYPFMGVTLIVEQNVVHTPDYCKTYQQPYINMIADTLTCKLVDQQGYAQGQGLSYYQYDFPISEVELHEGDSIYVKVWHDMKREILPGISDIGIRYYKVNP